MAYDPTDAAQNRALVTSLILSIDALQKAGGVIGQTVSAGSGQGVVLGLQAQGDTRLAGIGIPASLVLQAVMAVANAKGALDTLDENQGAAMDAFRNDFTVQAIRPRSCSC